LSVLNSPDKSLNDPNALPEPEHSLGPLSSFRRLGELHIGYRLPVCGVRTFFPRSPLRASFEERSAKAKNETTRKQSRARSYNPD
jgi:hypothetical protein